MAATGIAAAVAPVNVRTEAPDDTLPSTAAVNGHPVHPMIVPFPIAFLTGALATDIAWLATRNAFWADCSFWLLAAGVVMAAVAAVFGLADFLGDRRVRDLAVAKLHFAGNAIVIVLAAVNAWRRMGDPVAAIQPTGLALSIAVVLLLVLTGWLGGELAYRHRVGVVPRGEGRKAPTF